MRKINLYRDSFVIWQDLPMSVQVSLKQIIYYFRNYKDVQWFALNRSFEVPIQVEFIFARSVGLYAEFFFSCIAWQVIEDSPFFVGTSVDLHIQTIVARHLKVDLCTLEESFQAIYNCCLDLLWTKSWIILGDDYKFLLTEVALFLTSELKEDLFYKDILFLAEKYYSEFRGTNRFYYLSVSPTKQSFLRSLFEQNYSFYSTTKFEELEYVWCGKEGGKRKREDSSSCSKEEEQEKSRCRRIGVGTGNSFQESCENFQEGEGFIFDDQPEMEIDDGKN